MNNRIKQGTLLLIIICLTSYYASAKPNIKNKENYNNLINGCKGIVVNDNGNIYIGDLDKKEVDVYNSKGNYITSLSCETGGDFNIDIDNNNNILVGITREEYLLIYDENGELISSKNDPNAYNKIGFKNGKIFKDKKDNIYKIENQSYFGRTSVTKTNTKGIKTTIMTADYSEYIKKLIENVIIDIIYICFFIIIVFIIVKKVKNKKVENTK